MYLKAASGSSQTRSITGYGGTFNPRILPVRHDLWKILSLSPAHGRGESSELTANLSFYTHSIIFSLNLTDKWLSGWRQWRKTSLNSEQEDKRFAWQTSLGTINTHLLSILIETVVCTRVLLLCRWLNISCLQSVKVRSWLRLTNMRDSGCLLKVLWLVLCQATAG